MAGKCGFQIASGIKGARNDEEEKRDEASGDKVEVFS
jgi:hypothetical protein